MGGEHDSWFKPFGFDLGKFASDAVTTVEKAATAVVEEGKSLIQKGEAFVSSAVTTVKQTVTGTGPSASPSAGASKSGGSVGQGGQNNPDDVKAVQTALNSKAGAGLAVDGNCGGGTIAAIKAFQKTLGQANPDGRIDPGGATSRALTGGASAPSPSSAQGSESSGGFFDGLKAFGQKVVQGATDALNNPGAALSDISGGRQSVVSNPNVPETLSGGGTASAGDSFFVTGAQKAVLLKKATAIKSAASGIYAAEAALEGQAKDDKSLLDSLKNLKAVADGMFKLANAINSVKGSENAEALGKAGKVSEVGDALISVADTVATVQDADSKLKAFQAKPNKETAEAWARSVGDVFDKAAAFVPSEGLPGFIPAMWKGLLSAPKSYINAFITMQNVYYGNIDKEAGLSGPGMPIIGRNATRRFGDMWEGDLTDMFSKGWFVEQRNKKGQTFCDFMTAHRKTGPDLWRTTVDVGKGVLLAAISRLEDEDPAKDVWVVHIGKFQNVS